MAGPQGATARVAEEVKDGATKQGARDGGALAESNGPSPQEKSEDTKGQTVSADEVVQEGLAKVVFRKGEVFYNPVQAVNRDLSVLAIRDFVSTRRAELDRAVEERRLKAEQAGRELSVKEKALNDIGLEGFSVLEALSATGLRAIRYRKEVSGLGKIVANDLDEAAFESIKKNIAMSDVSTPIDVSCRDAVELMMERRGRTAEKFDVIDLDPYGSASNLLDSAVQAIADGGLLCVTCTDGPVLCGNNPEVCMYRYGSMSVKSSCFAHEMAIRTVLYSIQRDANRYQRTIEPVVCLFIDFYVRVFVRVYDRKPDLKRSPTRVGMVYQCTSCHSFETVRLGSERKGGGGSTASKASAGSHCRICGRPYTIVGPVWLDPLYDPPAVARLYRALDDKKATASLKMRERVQALLRVVSEEVVDCPLFLNLNMMVHTLRASSPPQSAIFAAIASRGYRVSVSHTMPNGCKTDAPHELVWDIMRCWVKLHPVRAPPEDSAAKAILDKEPTLVEPDTINFNAKYTPPGRAPGNKAPRFPQNPTKFWGPGTRATGKRPSPENDEVDTAKRHKGADGQADADP